MSEENNDKNVQPKLRSVQMNIFWFIVIILTTIIASVVITAISISNNQERAVNVGTDTRTEFAKLYSVYDTLTENYYEDVDSDALIESSIRGMVEGLEDPYSEYMSIDETDEFEESITGDFEGIGAEVMQEGSKIIISSPMKGSPAEQAGIEPGDQILAVDGDSLEGKTTTEAVQLIRGEKGTDVVLTIQRGSGSPTDITITRDTIHIDSVTYEKVDGVGHISINRFQQGTTDEFSKFIDEAANDGVKELIIDFRYNPGGLLNEAVTMINQFIEPETAALYLEDNTGNQQEIITENEKNENTESFNEVYILINEGSASASEVFTGALDDLTDVTIAGTTSFGKGVVQRTSEFKDNSMLKYTNTKWLTPDKTWVQDDGIKPDIELINPDYYRIELLTEDEVFAEGQENEKVLSIKVALDALGYDIKSFDNHFDAGLTAAVKAYQNDKNLTADGIVTGETTTGILSDIREKINDNDAQLNYLIDYINGDQSIMEIEQKARNNAPHIPPVTEDEQHLTDEAEDEEE
ncbi:putative CtpA-like serine protease [Jeotgalicoccus saudimassiliensis]|uniref:Probable CtpA-like serine protease n=1 Tax=Jeotgalicoccus saudimassiliensis TaxID=1461582 RepID=A0A078M4K3_9STAP|nr:S41 family peptidase [Jeotgalicoccus saudimassiliensis]CEA00277.1 putative CtpA-like serine protease [Jeotgalicoccus saudimassiliensis]